MGVGEQAIDGLDDELDAALAALTTRPQVLVGVDFDGTLAPIVPVPDDARPLPRAHAALARLARRPGVHLAIVSGRSLPDLRRLAAPPPGAVLIGGHGAEVDDGPSAELDDVLRTRPTDPLLAEVIEALRAISERHPGTHVETKATSAVLHTRRAPRPGAAVATDAALAGPARLPGVHVMRGKEVVEISVSDVTKGSALADLRRRLALPPGTVLYVGDDVTDERAFAVLDPAAGDVPVKVGDGDTVASFRVADPLGVADLLERLVILRGGG